MTRFATFERTKRITLPAIAIAGGLAVSACGESSSAVPYCTVSPETTTVTIPRNGGIDTAILQIAGVDRGTCFQTAKETVVSLNPDQNINAPHVGQEVVIPLSAEFHLGD